MKMIVEDIDVPPVNDMGLKIRDSYIDTQVYKKNTSLRICNSYKRSRHDNKIIRKSYDCDQKLFMNTCINYIDNCIILPQNVGMTTHAHFDTNNKMGYTPLYAGVSCDSITPATL